MTEKRKAFLINFAYVGVLCLLAFAVVKYLLPMAAPFVLGFLVAWFLRRPVAFLREKLGLKPKTAAVLAVVLFYGVVGVAISFLGVKAVGGLAGLIGNLPTMYTTHVQPFFMDILFNLEAFAAGEPVLAAALEELGTRGLQSFGDMIQGISVAAMGAVTGIAAGIPGAFIKLVLMIISTFFIAIDYERLTGFCLRQMSEEYKNLFLQIKEYVVGTLWVCIRSYALIMSITFVELAVALSLVGISHAVLVAACISVFDILPVLGTGGIMIPWTVLAALQGNGPLALKLLLVYIVITVIRNILEPKIVGGQLGLHPVVTLCSMFVGAQVLGVVGLFGAPIL
ncbi:MAG: sporulation integral membrane protein YtvI, partial [Oscillospiraceae bacterium]|nr:sporulation integral membrane protein YtvI [Oscillospiraceae bacterium]